MKIQECDEDGEGARVLEPSLRTAFEDAGGVGPRGEGAAQCRVRGAGRGAQGAGRGVQGAGHGVQGVGCRVHGVRGMGCRVWGEGHNPYSGLLCALPGALGWFAGTSGD